MAPDTTTAAGVNDTAQARADRVTYLTEQLAARASYGNGDDHAAAAIRAELAALDRVDVDVDQAVVETTTGRRRRG